jgi:2-keto-4-pentenoate hydratase/2-oxohepta-3-ene-1,7-dioic acid hydratase in catechol pathway
MARSRHTDRMFGKFAKKDKVFVGEVQGHTVLELKSSSMMDIVNGKVQRRARSHDLEDLSVHAPVDRPSKIICIGLNYRSHINEMKWEIPKKPIIFTKPSSAIIGPREKIVIPRASSRVDYEGESAVIVGRRARHVKDGARYIFGYTCFNDVTARDLQRVDVDWTRAKGFDTFAPVGPFISTRCPTRVVTRLNGRVVQDAPLSDRVFDDAALVEYISSVMTLEPGDIIATGTPAGIAPMKDGDVVQVELDTVGTLTNQVVKSP